MQSISRIKTPRRACTYCGDIFRVTSYKQQYCTTCMAWDQVARHVAAVDRLLKVVK